jgi:2-methylcitrate dehydratase PrpD
VPASERAGPFAGERLGQFLAGSRWEELDPALRHEGTRALLNFFGAALGAAEDEAVATAVQVMQPFSGPTRVTVIGRRERLDAMGAAFVNAIAANLLDYDDTHLATVIHPTAPVAPPVFALAEQQDLPGAAVLHAFILGAEVECRIGAAVSPGHYARGWHITSTCGVFGAAAACGKLLGLTAAQHWAALGIAASQSAGVVESLATPAKNVGMGNAARNGLLAALLARAGYTAAPAALEGPLGWARAMGDAPRLERITADLGAHWEFRANTYKPYPSGIVFHAVIDACLALRERLGLSPASIAAVRVHGNQLLLDRGDRPVHTERDARVSIHHCAAVALARGRAGPAEFGAAGVADPVIVTLRGKVEARLDPSLPQGAAAVEVTATDGRTDRVQIGHARGSMLAPLSDRELEAKFRANAMAGGSAPRSDERLARIWEIAEAKRIAPLMAVMSSEP